MIPILDRVAKACEKAAETARAGDLEARHRLLLEAQRDLGRFKAIMARVVMPGREEDLLLLNGFARRFMELSNLTGEAAYAERAADLARYVLPFWQEFLTAKAPTK